jgi:hypothetical protein
VPAGFARVTDALPPGRNSAGALGPLLTASDLRLRPSSGVSKTSRECRGLARVAAAMFREDAACGARASRPH